jgi:hypothetical protein
MFLDAKHLYEALMSVCLSFCLSVFLSPFLENFAFPRSKVKPRGVKRSQEETSLGISEAKGSPEEPSLEIFGILDYCRITKTKSTPGS